MKLLLAHRKIVDSDFITKLNSIFMNKITRGARGSDSQLTV